jgi:hypothetical protein
MRSAFVLLFAFAACAAEPEGKVFVQSVPPGANILVNGSEGTADTGVKTPGMVSLPKGMRTLVLRKEGFVDAPVTVVVGDAIVKPDVVKMIVPRAEVEVTSDDPGWRLFVDGKPLFDKAGAVAVTPCTVSLPVCTCQIGWAKAGFVDVVQKVTVEKETVSLEMKAKPSKGGSRLLLLRPEVVPGWYLGKNPEWSTKIEIRADGLVRGPKFNDGSVISPEPNGRWSVKGNELVFAWFKFGIESLEYDGATGVFANKKGFSLTPVGK